MGTVDKEDGLDGGRSEQSRWEDFNIAVCDANSQVTNDLGHEMLPAAMLLSVLLL